MKHMPLVLYPGAFNCLAHTLHLAYFIPTTHRPKLPAQIILR